ncbi:MAG: GTP-binding protein [Caldilineaceae bacterium]
MTVARIPVTILTGFLGAGKTTLLNYLLHAKHGRRMAVLVNDFGAVNIDAQLIVGVEDETIQLSNGCICCTLRGALEETLLAVAHRPEPPEYIIIETSGVADPKAVAVTLLLSEDLNADIQVDSILTVIDAEQIGALRAQYAQLAKSQISVADIVLLNKVDLVSREEVAVLKAWIQQITPAARILETSYGQAPLALLLGVDHALQPKTLLAEPALDVHVHEASEAQAHHHDLLFHTWTYTSDRPLALEAVRKTVQQLPTAIFRVKGFLFLREQPEQRALLQAVGRRVQIDLDGQTWGEQSPRTQLVMIGMAGGVEPMALRAAFEACTSAGEE